MEQRNRNTRGARKRPPIRRRRRRSVYKPDYARVRQIALTKRIIGVLLALLLAAAAAAVLLTWVIPSALKALEPSPAAMAESDAPAEGESALEQPLGYDEETGLPLYGDDFNLFVINEENPAESDFAPVLAEAAGVEVDARIAPALSMLTEKAHEAGIELEFSAGFVSYEAQAALYAAQVEALVEAGSTKVMAREDARRTAPAPGESDMQTGLCVTLRYTTQEEDAGGFAGSAAYSWLQSSMGKYGFVFRYPADKADYTGVGQNDLVLRYIGPENAAAMRRLSMCLEEYVEYAG